MIELNKEYELSYPAIDSFIEANSDLFKELYISVDYYIEELYFIEHTTDADAEIEYIEISDVSEDAQFDVIYCKNNNMQMFELIINFISELRKFNGK